MASKSYSFIDIAVLDAVRERFVRGETLAILDSELEQVVWANGPGAQLLGFDGVADATGAAAGLSLVTRRQISSLAGFPALPRPATVSVRFSRGASTQLVMLTAEAVRLTGETMVLLSLPAAAASPVDILGGLVDEGQAAALLDAQAKPIAVSKEFSGLGLAQATLDELVRDVRDENDRLVKRKIYGARGLYPAAIARLSDSPAQHLLLVVAEAEAPRNTTRPSIAGTAPARSDYLSDEFDGEAGLPGEKLADVFGAHDLNQSDVSAEPEADEGIAEQPLPDKSPQSTAPVIEARTADTRPVVDIPRDDRNSPPARFVWRTDAAGRFSAVSDEFGEAVGLPAADILGRAFKDVATVFALDHDGEVAGLLERRDTWSGRTLWWPVAGTDLQAPVDLAALPVYGRERNFEGFRGFGVVRRADARPDPERIGLSLTPGVRIDELVEQQTVAEPEVTLTAPEPDFEDDPFRGEVPALQITAPIADDSEDKVVRLAERRQTSFERNLSSVERQAFREIGERLRREHKIEPPAFGKRDHVPGAMTTDGTTDGKKAGDQSGPEVAQTPDIVTSTYRPELAAAQREAARVARVRQAPDVGVDKRHSGEQADDLPAHGSVPDRTSGAPDDHETIITSRDSDWLADQTTGSEETPEPPGDDIPGNFLVDDYPYEEISAEELADLQALDSEPEGLVDPALNEPREVPDDVRTGAVALPIADTFSSDETNDPQTIDVAEEFDDEFSPAELTGTANPVVGYHADDPQPELQRTYRTDTTILDQLPVPLLIHSGDQLHYANPEFLRLTGYESLAGLEAAGGLDELFVDAYDDAEVEHELRIRSRNGETFPAEAVLRSAPWAGRKALMLVIRQTGEAIAASASTEDLRQRLDEMRTIINTATDGFILVDKVGAIRSISEPAEALFGFDSDMVKGKPLYSLFDLESQGVVMDYLSNLSLGGVASVLNDGREVVGREAEGRAVPLFMTMGRLPGDGGFCAVVRDITPWKKAEDELTRARTDAELASAQKSDFLARISHEIRTPLNAIIGFSELMVDEKFGPISNDRYRDYLRDINRSGNHVLDLVNDLLDLSKIEAGQQEMAYEAVALNDTLAEAVSMIQPQANRERVIIRSSFAPRLPDIVADLRSIRQIALNILSNAVRYTQAGGQVVISTSYESGQIVLRVRDTGVGMSQAELEQAMKPFQQINALKRARGDGTGLGLPLTKAMVEANRARFAISSSPGEGTLVEITFPSTRVLAQ